MNNRIRSSRVQLGKSVILEHKKSDFTDGLSGNQQCEKKAFDSVTGQVRSQAEKIIAQAEKKAAETVKIAEKVLKKAEEDARQKSADIENLKQQSIEQGYAEGFQKGYDDGIARSKQEAADKIRAVDVLTSASFKVKKEIIDSAEKEIIELSIAIAEKIIRQKLELKPGLMHEIIKSAIEQLQDREEIKIIVNPVLTDDLYEFAEGLQDKIKGLGSVKITEDRTIPSDGVIVESPDSRIDGRIETQLAEIVKNLLREFSEKSNSEGICKEIEIRIDDVFVEEEKNDNEN